MDVIQLEIPEGIHGDKALREWIESNPDLLRKAMDLDTSHLDPRANVDLVSIAAVSIDGDEVIVTYEYEYSVYAGCSDMNYSGTEDGLVISGERQGRIITFPKFYPAEKRSTYDEF